MPAPVCRACPPDCTLLHKAVCASALCTGHRPRHFTGQLQTQLKSRPAGPAHQTLDEVGRRGANHGHNLGVVLRPAGQLRGGQHRVVHAQRRASLRPRAPRRCCCKALPLFRLPLSLSSLCTCCHLAPCHEGQSAGRQGK